RRGGAAAGCQEQYGSRHQASYDQTVSLHGKQTYKKYFRRHPAGLARHIAGSIIFGALWKAYHSMANAFFMRTIILLCCSNLFMTIAWYGHLRFGQVPLWKVILVSWGIAFFEFCFQ